MERITLKARRQGLGYTGQEFAELLRSHLPTLTENRLVKIEGGRLKATPAEKEIICRLLNCKSFEIGI